MKDKDDMTKLYENDQLKKSLFTVNIETRNISVAAAAKIYTAYKRLQKAC